MDEKVKNEINVNIDGKEVSILVYNLDDELSRIKFKAASNATEIQTKIKKLDHELRNVSRYGCNDIFGEKYTDIQGFEHVAKTYGNLVDIIRGRLSEMMVE